ncbi:MAG: class II glutamine amidotransferase [Bosea sp. (in: a-proteobacteria)]
MCRFLAYSGQPTYLEDLVAAPCHSLIHQSMHAEEAKTVTNGDGFGLGWYGERAEPGVYREIRPAWSDENLLSIAKQVRSRLFFAHVRAATGTATTRANCHPFTHGRHLFMHNGQIGGYHLIRRQLDAMLPDHLYSARLGTTDTEALFLLVMAYIEQGLSPTNAFATMIGDTVALMEEAGIDEPLRFAAALTDGETLYAIRWSSNPKPPSLYVCERGDSIVIASEPVDANRDCWKAVPENSIVTVAQATVRIAPLTVALKVAA